MNITQGMGAGREMPRYKCHKQVWALKIKSITKANPPTIEELEKIINSEDDKPVDILSDGSLSVAGQKEEIVGAIIVPEDDGYAEFTVNREYMLKHNPQVGGYYVVYDDGYKSYSPAKAFEDGYTRI